MSLYKPTYVPDATAFIQFGVVFLVFFSVGPHASPFVNGTIVIFKLLVCIYLSLDCKLYEGRACLILACAHGLTSSIMPSKY